MTTYFISRHRGAIEWARRRGITAQLVEHLDPARISTGDVVLGTLPVNMIADINAKGARYEHLTLELPPSARGAELSADDMERYGARLVEYRAMRVGQADNADNER